MMICSAIDIVGFSHELALWTGIELLPERAISPPTNHKQQKLFQPGENRRILVGNTHHLFGQAFT